MLDMIYQIKHLMGQRLDRHEYREKDFNYLETHYPELAKNTKCIGIHFLITIRQS